MRESVALVTGAARGIGRRIAEVLCDHGATVVAADVQTADWGGSSSHGGRVVHRRLDVSSTAQVDALVESVEQELGPIDHLVHCAGVLRPGPVTECTDEDWAATFAVNTTGVFVTTRAVLPRMMGRGRGSMVTVASNAARIPRMSMAAYGASKAASLALTKAAGLEAARHGVRCNAVLPGSTDAPMLRALWDDADLTRATLQGDPTTFRLGIPLGRIADADDVAAGVVYLLSDRARHVTMHELVIDGGATLGG